MDSDRPRLLTREEIRGRLSRMVGERGKHRPDGIMLVDVARWMGMQLRDLKRQLKNENPISNEFQIRYSRFFALVESGRLIVNPGSRPKELIHVEPKAPPKPPVLPRLDFSGNVPQIKWDR